MYSKEAFPLSPPVPRPKKRDIITLGSSVMVVAAVSLLAASLFFAMSPDMSLKEFLDRNFLDSLDGNLTSYKVGDTINITDTVSSISFENGYSIVDLCSIKGTRYAEGSQLIIRGDITPDVKPGDRVRIVLTVGLSNDENREVFLPLTPGDIHIISGE